MAAGPAAEDSVLMLHTHDVDGVDVQEVRSAAVRCDVALADLEADPCRVCVTLSSVVHCKREAVELGKLGGDGVAEIGRERGDAALARQVIAEHRDLAGADDGVDDSSRLP